MNYFEFMASYIKSGGSGSSGGGIPIFMLTTEPTSGGANLSDDEIAFFSNLLESETTTVLVMFDFERYTQSTLCTIFFGDVFGYEGLVTLAPSGIGDNFLMRLFIDVGNGTLSLQKVYANPANFE